MWGELFAHPTAWRAVNVDGIICVHHLNSNYLLGSIFWSESTFNVLQLNANGFGSKLTELWVVLEINKAKVAAIQESKLSPKSKNPCIRNYTTVCKDRPPWSWRRIVYFYSQIDNLLQTAIVTRVAIWSTHGRTFYKTELGNTKLIISNIYIPPASSCTNVYQSSIEHLLTTPDTLILGNVNAHHPSWYSRSTDTRGRKMSDLINGSVNCIINWDRHIRLPPNAKLISPDVSLASASLITSCSWQTLLTLSSDYLPILIRLQMKTPSTPGLHRTYVTQKKDNWDRYRQEVEAALSKRFVSPDCQRDQKIFRTVLLKAAPYHIPTEYSILHGEPVTAEIMDVMNRWDDLRKRNPTSHELTRLNKDIDNRICLHKQQKGRDFVETMVQPVIKYKQIIAPSGHGAITPLLSKRKTSQYLFLMCKFNV